MISTETAAAQLDVFPFGELGAEELAAASTVLARLVGDPQPLEEDEAAEAMELLQRISPDLFREYEANSAQLAGQWNREKDLFAGSCGAIRLEESVYKPWTTDESHPLHRTSGLAYGDPAVHMARILDRFGLVLDPDDDPGPDHLAVLLELLGFLLENRPYEEVLSFCRDHLDWLSDLRTRAEAEDAPLLAAVIGCAQQLVQRIAIAHDFV